MQDTILRIHEYIDSVARLFAESLCNGRIEELTDNKHNLTERSKVLTAHYRNQIFIEWEEKLKDLYDIGTNSEEFELIEYNYKNLKITDPETCFIRLRTSTILNMSEILEMKEGEPLDKIVYVDYDFNIGLIKVPIPSRFLGNYMRWRIFSFNYEKGKPYNFKEMIDAFK